jgi:hypothetical protein
VPLLKRQGRSHQPSQDIDRVTSLPNGTMRTVDLIERFPMPPAGGARAESRVQGSNQSDADLVINQEEPPDLPGIRGESRARYRYSGMPVYDLDSASLRSFDQWSDENLQPVNLTSSFAQSSAPSS